MRTDALAARGFVAVFRPGQGIIFISINFHGEETCRQGWRRSFGFRPIRDVTHVMETLLDEACSAAALSFAVAMTVCPARKPRGSNGRHRRAS